MKPFATSVLLVALGCSFVPAFAAAEGSVRSGNGQIVFVQNHL